jgi:RimJ/RimL family protein N-acetyltransferase
MIWWPTEIPTLQYGRLTLRRAIQDDVQPIFEACQDPLIPRFTTVPSEYTILHAQNFVDRTQESLELERELPFVITFDVADGVKFAGVISLHTINSHNHCAEIGYWMHPEMRGQGIATTAAKLITNLGITSIGFRRIEGVVDVENIASQKLLLKAGYEREGVLKKKVTREDGSQLDMAMLAVTADTWKELEF